MGVIIRVIKMIDPVHQVQSFIIEFIIILILVITIIVFIIITIIIVLKAINDGVL